MKSIKLTNENYLELLKDSRGNDFTFLENYVTSKTPILCRCNKCNNEWKVAPYELIKRKSNCPICSKNNQKEKFTKDLSYYEEKIISYYGYNPYIFLTKYTGIHNLMKVKCKECNNVFEVSMNNIMNNIRLERNFYCPSCSSKKLSDKLSTGKNNFQKQLDSFFGKEHSYDLLSDYVNTKTKMKFRCRDCGFEFYAIPQNIIYSYTKYGRKYCQKCNNIIRSDKSYEERLKELNCDIINIEEYKGRKIPIKHKCLVCNYEWTTKPDNLLNGNKCPNCSKNIVQSNNEKELIDFIKSFNIEVIEKDKSILDDHKELDLYLPEYNIAFEINGIYWHSNKFKDNNYHLNKTLLCEEKGIRLIHIFDTELIEKPVIVKSKIKSILNLNNELPKIYARKCTVKEISTESKNDFLDKNHLQGKDKSCIRLGLYYDDKLVSVMTFSRLRKVLGNKNKKEGYYELSRFASDINYHVVGGFGKLFKYFKSNYIWDEVITYADRRWSVGNLYIKNGFELDHISKPSYWYMDHNCKKLYHRYNFRKQKLKDLFPDIYSDEKTEFEIMEEAKYKRIYDCGNLVFIYKNIL